LGHASSRVGPEKKPLILRCPAWQFIVTFANLFGRPGESFSRESAFFLEFSSGSPEARWVLLRNFGAGADKKPRVTELGMGRTKLPEDCQELLVDKDGSKP